MVAQRKSLEDNSDSSKRHQAKNKEAVARALTAAKSKFVDKNGNTLSGSAIVKQAKLDEEGSFWNSKLKSREQRWHGISQFVTPDLGGNLPQNIGVFAILPATTPGIMVAPGDTWIVATGAGSIVLAKLYGVYQRHKGGVRPFPALELSPTEQQHQSKGLMEK